MLQGDMVRARAALRAKLGDAYSPANEYRKAGFAAEDALCAMAQGEGHHKLRSVAVGRHARPRATSKGLYIGGSVQRFHFISRHHTIVSQVHSRML